MVDSAFKQAMHINVNARIVDGAWHRVPLSGNPMRVNELVAYVASAYVDGRELVWFAAPAETKMTGVHMTREMGRLQLQLEYCQTIDWALMQGGKPIGMPSEEMIEQAVIESARALAGDGPMAVFALLQDVQNSARTFEFWHPPLVSSEVLWRVFKASSQRTFG